MGDHRSAGRGHLGHYIPKGAILEVVAPLTGTLIRENKLTGTLIQEEELTGILRCSN